MRLRSLLLLLMLAVAVAPAGAQPVNRLAIGGNVAGLTVTGQSTIRVPADVLRVSLFLGPQTNPVTAMSNADTVVAVMKKNGAADAAVVMPLGTMRGPLNLTVNATLRKPTDHSIRDFVQSVSAALPAEIAFNGFNTTLALDSCDAASERAVAAAIADARRIALRAATLAGVSLGSVIAISVNGANCPTVTNPQQINPMNQFESSSTLDLSVFTSVSVTYAIR